MDATRPRLAAGRLFTGLVTSGLLLTVNGSLARAELAPADRAKVVAGQTMVFPLHESGMAGIEAVFWVHASPALAFQVLDDTRRMVEYMPAMKACTVLESGPGYVVAKMVGDAGELVERRLSHPPDRIDWTLVHGTGLRNLEGHWLLELSSGGTLLHYAVVVQPALPIPEAVVSYFQNRNLPAMVSNVRARIESGGTWVKPEYAPNR